MKLHLNGADIDYTDQGTGLPVIFIHAFPLNKTMWYDQVEVMRLMCRAITLDLRGFGRSDAPPGPYLMDQMASDVRGLLTSLEIERATLVGLSMGGYISLAFYRDYPEAVEAMVLADTRATADGDASREKRLKSAEKAERDGVGAIADELIPQLLGSSTLRRKPEVADRVRSMIEANSPSGIAGAQRGMAARLDSTPILGSIDRPALIIVGDEDLITPVAEAEALRDGIRDSRLIVIKGAGHLSNIERPQEFSAALSDFIRLLL